MEKGYLERGSEGWRLVEYVNEVAFIPNSFVSVSSGYSPLCRLVTHGELEPLLLAAELYQVQDLMEERGVPLSVLRAYYYAYGETRIGEGHRLHRLWPGRPDPETGKKRKESYTQSQHRKWRTRNFWENLKALEGAHVVEWSVYSANGKPADNQFGHNRPVRPLGAFRNGRHVATALESLPAFASYLIAQLADGQDVLGKGPQQLIGQWLETSPIIAVESQSVAHVEGIGILRMTHRAATDNTSVWYRETRDRCREELFFVEQVARASFPQALGIFQGLQAQGNIGDAISTYLNDSSSQAQ